MIRVPQSQPEVADLVSLHQSRIQRGSAASPIRSAFSSRMGSPSPHRPTASDETREDPQQTSKPLVSGTKRAPDTPYTVFWLILLASCVFFPALTIWVAWCGPTFAAVTTMPSAPAIVSPTLVNWALPDFGAQILPKSRLGERSNFLVEKWIRPTKELYRLLEPTDPPDLCMSTPVGSRMVLSLPKQVDIRKIVIRTKFGPVNTAIRAWDGVRLTGVEAKHENGVYEVNSTSSVLDLHFDGDGCIYGIEIWGL